MLSLTNYSIIMFITTSRSIHVFNDKDDIVFCKWLCLSIFMMYWSVLLFTWYLHYPVNTESNHIIDKDVRMLLVVDDDSGDQRSQLIFLLDLILISVITIHVSNVNIVFCKWLCSSIFRMYLSVLLFTWYLHYPVNTEK
jgi:hypothetical protein